MIRLEWIMPHRNSFVLVRIKGQASGFDGLDVVAAEQSVQLLQRNSHPLAQRIRVSGMFGSQSAFEIVESRQQVFNKCFFRNLGPTTTGARLLNEKNGRVLHRPLYWVFLIAYPRHVQHLFQHRLRRALLHEWYGKRKMPTLPPVPTMQ
jgi:hypothetical protein